MLRRIVRTSWSVLPIHGHLRPAARDADGPQVGHGNDRYRDSRFHVQREHERHSHRVVDSAADHHRLQSAHFFANRPTDHVVGHRWRIWKSGRLLDRSLLGCPTCATITGSLLTAVSVGSVKVDANQAGGTANGNQYAAATQVQTPITIAIPWLRPTCPRC